MLDKTKIVKNADTAWTDSNKPPETPKPNKSVIDDLRNGGTLSRTLPGYQERTAQIEMAQLVEQAIQEGKHGLVEASTGTGKSLGYLIPVIRSGRKAIVSTANKALQEQLYNKDIPFCQQHIEAFDAALLKGKSNYLCLQRFNLESNEGLQYHVQDLSFKRIEKAVGNNWNGDFETLPFSVSGEIRSRINVDDNDCARRKCPLFSECYYYKIREEAKQARIIITNHDLLLLNAQSHNKLLPPHDIIIVDEAHALEPVASKQFSTEIRPSQITSLLALQRIKSYTEEKTQDQAKEQAEHVWTLLEKAIPNNGRIALVDPIQEGLTLARTLERLSNQLSSKRPANATTQEDELYTRTISRTDKLAESIHTLFSVKERKSYAYYLERANDHIIAAMTPLDVAPMLRDTLFSQDSIIICTSATLATPSSTDGTPSFQYFCEQTGMDSPNNIASILPLAFNYRENALLYLPNDMPEPAYGKTAEAATYERALAERMQLLTEASRGRAFLLFSSRRMLNITADQIIPHLQQNGYTTLIQGDLPVSELIKQFRTSCKAVLFGLKTFWEGVDVAGEALSLVVIDKLPFSPMDDPVVAAKLKYIEAKGQNAFFSHSLPAITLNLKQGVGRLIRSDTDQGVMAILDTRLHTKPYGKRILSCLPPARRVTALTEVQNFFSPLRDEIQDFSIVRQALEKRGRDRNSYFKQITNGEIIDRMQAILQKERGTEREIEWLRTGLRTIKDSLQPKK